MTFPLILRRDAAQATLDKFRRVPFAWGQSDCVRVAAFHLRQLGYRPSLARGGSYASEVGAIRALKRAGFDSLVAAVDALDLPRTGFASHLVGDLLGLDSGGEWPALAVALGNGRVLTSSAELGCYDVAQVPAERVKVCWRADPCLKR